METITERVYAPMDQDDTSSEGLLAVIIRCHRLKETSLDQGTHFLTDPTLPLQVAVLGHDAGHHVPPHRHPPVMREVMGTPEALIVAAGSYRMTLFTSRGKEVGPYTLEAGDVVVLVAGGHGFTALEESGMIEVKVGPYLGAADKVRF